MMQKSVIFVTLCQKCQNLKFIIHPILVFQMRISLKMFGRFSIFLNTVKLGDKELFGHPKIVP